MVVERRSRCQGDDGVLRPVYSKEALSKQFQRFEVRLQLSALGERTDGTFQVTSVHEVPAFLVALLRVIGFWHLSHGSKRLTVQRSPAWVRTE